MDQDKLTVALHEVVDPKVGVSIIDLGLVYHIQVEGGRVDIRMTMTTPACPLPESIRMGMETAIQRHLPEITEVYIEVVWDPPWHPGRMSERAKRQLGWFGQ
ncbi:protein of unknown function DUF59 [Nitrosococcus halophilus Nc 4]|uniref:MIP18 family-like domain-containing protein n=1 Tax=Nitrosococcus halophilus (strain Nc4) TaxID=472759 RepID=D5BY39_NITHN|nr:iron-sulfur cluster assembly protein [Nitrosococcus halophilus]ADE15950.1 protein of unknown function DUF59 [Nitrosococcus halophilus Nc 4]